ncbi:hypothetical protein M8J76_014218 [Diaphorina citri]|nr:hypothetical protein M8J75_001352 [Diaphorina citri]KAI5741494.1 hypothetical protein M8J76_014218 [Diaphorina citri]
MNLTIKESALSLNQTTEEALYDRTLLTQLDYSDFSSQFKQKIVNPGRDLFCDSLIVRPLHSTDYDHGFLEILKQLTSVGDISKDLFQKRFHRMKASQDYLVTVIEDTRTKQVIGTGSLILEQKFIHECALKGKIEEVVVDDTYRGKELGKLLIAVLVKLAKHFQCYKLTLDCADHMIPFYETFGFQKKNNFMQIYF